MQSWLYTKRNDFAQFDLTVEYWVRAGGNSGISIRDTSRAQYAIVTPVNYKKTPSKIGYEIQINNRFPDPHPTGSIYGFKDAEGDFLKENDWNKLEIESRTDTYSGEAEWPSGGGARRGSGAIENRPDRAATPRSLHHRHVPQCAHTRDPVSHGETPRALLVRFNDHLPHSPKRRGQTSLAGTSGCSRRLWIRCGLVRQRKRRGQGDRRARAAGDCCW